MDTFIYVVLSISYIVLFIVALFLSRRHQIIHYDNVIFLVILALLYDNGMLALGSYAGEGDLLMQLNEVRYWLHGFITPLLILFAWNTIRKTEIPFAKRPMWNLLIILFTLAIIFIEFLTLVGETKLEPKWSYGILSYDMVKEFEIPIMIFAVMASLLIASMIVWWRQKWPWYFIGVILMAVAPLIERWLETGAAHNVAELILMISLVMTKRFQDNYFSSERITVHRK